MDFIPLRVPKVLSVRPTASFGRGWVTSMRIWSQAVDEVAGPSSTASATGDGYLIQLLRRSWRSSGLCMMSLGDMSAGHQLAQQPPPTFTAGYSTQMGFVCLHLSPRKVYHFTRRP